VISFIFFTLNREPARAPERQPLAAREYWRRLPLVLKRNPNFRRYLGARVLVILGTMGTAFYMVYAKQRFAVPDTFAAELTMAALVSQAALTPLLGWLGDHKGNKWLIQLASVLQMVSIVMVFVAPAQGWLYLVFVLVYGASSAMSISGFAMSMEFSAPDDVPTFAALDATINAIPTMLAPLLAGWLIDIAGRSSGLAGESVAGFQVMFIAQAIFAVIGFVAMRRLVKEPRHEAPSVGISATE